MEKDLICLGKDCVYEAGNGQINENELVIGSTGSGKTKSVSEPRLLHTFHQSLVVPITKRELFYQYAPVLKERGYEIWDLNLESPIESEYGYNPCKFVHSDIDIMTLARNIAGDSESRSLLGEMDSYWSEATTSVLAAEIGLAVENAVYGKKTPSFSDVLKLHTYLEMDTSKSQCASNLDAFFDALSVKKASAQAPKLWKTIRGNSSKTAACIYSMVNNALDKISTPEIDILFHKEKEIDIKQLGQKKTALFITTSPVSQSVKKISDMLYGDIFRELYREAQANGGTLRVPVRIICDDFACGSRIPKFDEYISVFRAMGISVTILLQSLSQLATTYGEYASKTIQNNCDTCVFLGSMDIETCRDISIRTNAPLEKVLALPVGSAVVVRRGEYPVVTERYPIFEDKLYKQLFLEKVG